MDTHTLTRCFDSTQGIRIYERFLSCIEDFSMRPLLEKGVLLGFSGGADSVLCAALLLRLKELEFDFPILLCHINHGIRSEGAMRDQAFAQDFAQRFGFDFCTCTVDVPALAKSEHLGIEECARKVRYEKFNEIISGRNDIKTIVTAHNATDNLETVVQRLFRGAGTRGMCGIPALRDNVARPMLYIPKKEIVSLLEENQIPFVTDETNFDNKYTRNYVRNEIFPLLERLTDVPEESILRFVLNLREDEECLDKIADDFLGEFPDNIVCVHRFLDLPKAIQSRVLLKMLHRSAPDAMLERHHLETALSAIKARKRRQELVCKMTLNCEKDKIYISSKQSLEGFEAALPLNQEVSLNDGEVRFLLCDRTSAKTFSNVYKNSIQVFLSSAIIKGELRVRQRHDGDAYAFSGVTHRLKTLFNSLHLIEPLKAQIPVFYDEEGIVYVPPFLPRGQNKHLNGNDADRILFIIYPRLDPPWIVK